MPYTISQATDPLNIKEQEYASGPKIMFTKFTSCIGAIAKKGPTLTAVHLVIFAKDQSMFDANDVPKVLELARTLKRTGSTTVRFMCTVTFTRITAAGIMAIGMPGSGTRVAGSNRWTK